MERFYVHFYLLQYLEAKDLVYTPLFVAVVYFMANTFKGRLVGFGSPLQRYFIPALSLKMVGAIASGLVYQFYYHGGDTMDFYTSASFIRELIFDKPSEALGMFSSSPVFDYPELAQYDFLPFIYDPPTWTIIRFASFANIFAFDSYPVLAIYFSLFSLYSSWKFFRLLSEIYPDPKMIKKFAYCLFYIPSVFFWGSGVFKDSLTLSGLFLFTYHIYEIVIRRKFSPSQFLWLGLGIYLMYSIRLFFLIILVPCVGFWFFAEFRDKLIKNNFLKSISFPLLLIVSTAVIIFGLGRVMNSNADLSTAALKEKAEGFQSWHGSLGGSAYDLGITDYSVNSLIKVFPLAVNVTLFRPYIFIDAHSAFQMISALQSLFFLYFFLLTLYRTRLEFFTAITQDPMILFSLTFSIFYSFVAGFTSYNFGALDRYKIPALPFFMLALVLINYNYTRNKKQKQY
ncbi:MAG: hypothetical protein JWO03_3278 [Bacteroidetes bacterium]|nr:hypothetical protein [Bacteroidota bacterium]